MEHNQHKPIQDELDAIEAEAAEKTKALLAQQDDFLQALRLVEILKAHSQPAEALEKLCIAPCFYSSPRRYGFNIYGEWTSASAIYDALVKAGIPVIAADGFNAATARWTIAAYPDVQIFMPADMAAPAYLPRAEAA